MSDGKIHIKARRITRNEQGGGLSLHPKHMLRWRK